ncbi:MAG TPA: Lrp/AsnC ligand binding domain-containing protein [Chloroflexia bacterium]|nr:Lrp/AsnC ligand binding domain-containing protein [Chloroflexia bacterium]
MVTALVMINVGRHAVPDTAQALLKIDGVREVYSVTGEWDLVAIVSTPVYEQLAELVTGQLSAIRTITRTHTLMAFQCYSNQDMERLWDIGTEEAAPAF